MRRGEKQMINIFGYCVRDTYYNVCCQYFDAQNFPLDIRPRMLSNRLEEDVLDIYVCMSLISFS